MKKILALTLVLCMALASVPTFAETDFTGTWYMILSGITCFTFELNADGTCVGTSAVTAEAKQLSGTWSAEGDTVTLTIGDDPLPLKYDGTDLTFGMEEVATAQDGAAVNFPLKFSREPGEVTVAELNAYLSSGTLPEGKTKEDMENAVVQMAMFFMAFVEEAVSEIDYTGTWYLIMTGMTIGTFELNADGTCTGISTAPEAGKTLTGTWSKDGTLVTLRIGERPLTLAYNGTDLMIAALEVYADANTLEIPAFIKFAREPGVTVEEFNAYASTGAIPEGKTAADMELIESQLSMMLVLAELFD